MREPDEEAVRRPVRERMSLEASGAQVLGGKEAVGGLRREAERERRDRLQLDSGDARGADVERLHRLRGELLVDDQVAVARPESAGEQGERLGPPSDARVEREGVLRDEIGVWRETALLEVQLAEGRRAEGKPGSGTHLDRCECAAQERTDCQREPRARAEL